MPNQIEKAAIRIRQHIARAMAVELGTKQCDKEIVEILTTLSTQIQTKTVEKTIKAMKKRYIRFDDNSEVDHKADSDDCFIWAFGADTSYLAKIIEESLNEKE